MHSPAPREEALSLRPWRGTRNPARLLLIRFHAIGDVALVLPAAAHIAERWPGAELDLLTMSPAEEMAKATGIFRRVHIQPRAGGPAGRMGSALRTGLALRGFRYDAIIDIQRNYVSRLIRRIAAPLAWSEFERFLPLPAHERVLRAVAACGFASPRHTVPVPLRGESADQARRTLLEEGWDGSTRLVVFNPAGLWQTRNWPLENYVDLYRLWSREERLQVLMLGTDRIRERAEFIGRAIGPGGAINLSGRTTLGFAFAILRHAHVLVTEDSGLMHMGWALGIPVVALFGSTRSDWSSPPPGQSVCLDSSDLECGCCGSPRCRYGDVRCLTRRTPGEVLREARALQRRMNPEPQFSRS